MCSPDYVKIILERKNVLQSAVSMELHYIRVSLERLKGKKYKPWRDSKESIEEMERDFKGLELKKESIR